MEKHLDGRDTTSTAQESKEDIMPVKRLLPIGFRNAIMRRRTTVEDLLGADTVAEYKDERCAAQKVAREIVRRSQHNQPK